MRFWQRSRALLSVAAIPVAAYAATIGGDLTTPPSTIIASSSPPRTARPFQVILPAIPFPNMSADEVARQLLPPMQATKPRPPLTFTYDKPLEEPRPDYRLWSWCSTPPTISASDPVCEGVTALQARQARHVLSVRRLLPQRHGDVADDRLDAGGRPGRSACCGALPGTVHGRVQRFARHCGRNAATTGARGEALHRDSLLTRRPWPSGTRSPIRFCPASTPKQRTAWRFAR